MFCTVKLYPQGVSWSGFFPIKSYLQHCVWGMFCLLLSAKCYGEGSFINTPVYTIVTCAVSFIVVLADRLPLFLVAFHGPGGFPAEDIRVPFHDVANYIFVYV